MLCFRSESREELYLSEDWEKKLFCFAKPLLTSDVATRSSIWILFDRSSIENRMPALDENSIQYIKNAAGEVIYYAAGENVKENQEKVLDLAGKAAGEDGRKAANLKNRRKKLSSDEHCFRYFWLQLFCSVCR